MPDHVTTVTSYVEKGIDHIRMKPPTTYGIIVVRPPIEPGESGVFKNIILGRDRCLVDVAMLFKTGRATVFLAESSIEEPNGRRGDIEDIAQRIGELANSPDAALRLMNESPFAEPSKPEPTIQAAPPVDTLTANVPPPESLDPTPVGTPTVDVPAIKLAKEPSRVESPTIKVARIDATPLPNNPLPWPPPAKENDKN